MLNDTPHSRASRIAAPPLPQGFMYTREFLRTHMKNDDLRANRDELDHFVPRTQAKRSNNLVMQVAAGVFLGGLALWLVQLAATMLYAKLALATVTFGG
jgi:hypothetical protein